MPKSKIRRRSRSSHYNENAGILVGKSRIERYGKKSRPVPGSKLRVKKLSPYMGSMITAENRREYEKKQAEAFKERYIADVIAKRENIEKQEDKTPEEIAAEVEKFNNEQISEEQLEAMSKRFARYQSNKEKKQFSAWLAGRVTFTYKGQSFPVLTEAFLKQTKSIKDIVKVDEDGEQDTSRS